MVLSNNPSQNPEQTIDILNNNNYDEIIKNISKDFENKYPWYELKTFLENKPSLPLEVKVYNEYREVVGKIPDVYTLLKKNNKSANDYNNLLSQQNKDFFNDSQISKLNMALTIVKKTETIKELQVLGIGSYPKLINKSEALNSINTIEIKTYLILFGQENQFLINCMNYFYWLHFLQVHGI